MIYDDLNTWLGKLCYIFCQIFSRDKVRFASDMSFNKSCHFSLDSGTLVRLSFAALTTLIMPSSPKRPNWQALAAAPMYVRKNITGLPFTSFGGEIVGNGVSETTCKNTALTTSGYSRSIVSPAC
mmetsp:Transcript_5804/g.8424  ORF Transcript_5804/g.8424 Transcript_5804/m.8424 type:complete len:125 (-) Transcript_5804:57-431(-)